MIQLKKYSVLMICVAFAAACANVRAAQPLSDRVPADALVYVGWAGSQQLGSAYDQSHLKAVLDESSMQQLFSEALPRLIQRLSEKSPQARQAGDDVVSIGRLMWGHPAAFYLGPIDLTTSPPSPRIAILCDAGDDADALVAQMNDLITHLPPNQAKMVAQKVGSLVVFSIGQPQDWSAQTFSRPLPHGALAAALGFVSASAQMQGDGALAVYVDVPAIMGQIDTAIGAGGETQAVQTWTKLRTALNLGGLRQTMASTGFAGADWSTQLFIGTDGSHAGVTAALSSAPLDDDLLSLAPQSVSRLGAGRLNLSAIFSAAQSLIDQLNPEMGSQISAGLARVNLILGEDIQHDLLDSLGDQWLSYTDLSVAGSGALGFVAVNKLANAKHADVALSQLCDRSNALLGAVIQQSHLTLQFSQVNDHGLTIHYLAAPFVAPCWAIDGDKLYLALYPQVIDAAVRFAGSKGPSILQNPRFVEMLHRLGDQKYCAVSYLDLPATAPQAYPDLLAISQLYLGLGDLVGAQTPPMVVPPLDELMPQVTPSMSVSWTDQAGYHMRSLTPFPGADALSAQAGTSMALGETAMMTSILLPSLNRARETANRVKCASNERQIGQAILLYSNDHHGQYPPDLGTLVTTEDITPAVFVCPSANTQAPSVSNMTPQQQADWVNRNSDYIYIGQGLNNQLPADRVVLYEKDGDHAHDGMNMLFGDGHVAFYRLPDAHQLIQRATGGGQQP